MGDVDLFYFLVDGYAGPFIDPIILKKQNPSEWNKVLLRMSEML